MTTDRELLELAAKAAGGGFVIGYWNPLTDDGDALRLAVALRLEIDIGHSGIATRAPNGVKMLMSAGEEPDVNVATRRAIVRAAAEIGKAMP